MKKTCLLFTVLIVLALTGCGVVKEQNISENSTENSTETSIETTGENTTDVVSGSIFTRKFEQEKELLLTVAKEYFGTGYTFIGTGETQKVWKIVPGDICRNYKNTKLGIQRNLNQYWSGCKVLETISIDPYSHTVEFWVKILKTSNEFQEIFGTDYKDDTPLVGWTEVIGYYILNKEEHPILENDTLSGTHKGFGTPFSKDDIYRENNTYYFIVRPGWIGGRSPSHEKLLFPNIDIYSSKTGIHNREDQIDDYSIRDWISNSFKEGSIVFNKK